MHKKGIKYLTVGMVIMLSILLSLIFIISSIFKQNEYSVETSKLSVENKELFAQPSTKASNVGFGDKIVGSTVWPIVNTKIYTNNNINAETGETIPALTECQVTDVYYYAFKVKYVSNGKGWNDSDASFKEAWVDSYRLLINLPDLCPDIQYNITNAYSSIFKIGSESRSGGVTNISGLTGKQLYTYDNYDGTVDGKIYNSKIGREEFVCPIIYPYAEDIAQAQKNAINHGYGLKIYDAYRPQNDVCDSFWSLTQAAMNSSTAAYNLINKNGWNLGWFVANPSYGGSSDHARGIAIDVTLVKNGQEVATPSDMHDLSTNSVKQTYPSGNYDAAPTANYTEETKLLHNIMVNETELGGLPSEWWHYNINRSSSEYSKFNNYVGLKNITYTDKTPLKITSTQYSTTAATNQNVTVTINTNKDIKTAKGSKSGDWSVSGKTAKFWYKENKENDVITLTDNTGNTVTTTVNVKNIDKEAPNITAQYSTDEMPTNEDVTVTVTSDKVISEIVGNGWSYVDSNKLKIKKTYAQTVSNEKVQVKDAIGNISNEITINVKIDKQAPIINNIQYDYDDADYVYVFISANEQIAIGDLGNSAYATIINTSEAEKYGIDRTKSVKLAYVRESTNNTNATSLSDTPKAFDLAGNEVSVPVSVDIYPPKLNIQYTPDFNEYTTGTKTVTITATDENIEKYETEANGWTKSNNRTLTKIYSENTKETITIYDKNGNKETKKITVKNIDKEAPYIKSENTVQNENGSVTVTLTLNETVKEINSWTLYRNNTK